MTTIHTFISTSYKQQQTIIEEEENKYLFIYLFILLDYSFFLVSLFLSGNTGVFS